MVTADRLPYDILVQTFPLLQKRDLCAVASVCRAWNAAGTAALYSSIELRPVIRVSDSDSTLKLCNSLRIRPELATLVRRIVVQTSPAAGLSISREWINIVLIVLDQCPHIVGLSVLCDAVVVELVKRDIFRHLALLSELALNLALVASGTASDAICCCFEGDRCLRSLSLQWVDGQLSNSLLGWFTTSGTQLKELRLSNSPCIDLEFFTDVLRQTPHLTVLHLDNTLNTDVIYVLNLAPRLEALQITLKSIPRRTGKPPKPQLLLLRKLAIRVLYSTAWDVLDPELNLIMRSIATSPIQSLTVTISATVTHTASEKVIEIGLSKRTIVSLIKTHSQSLTHFACNVLLSESATTTLFKRCPNLGILHAALPKDLASIISLAGSLRVLVAIQRDTNAFALSINAIRTLALSSRSLRRVHRDSLAGFSWKISWNRGLLSIEPNVH